MRYKAYNSMKLGALVALRPSSRVFGLAGAELAEVFGSLGDYILEEFKRDATKRLTCRVLVCIVLFDRLDILSIPPRVMSKNVLEAY